MTDFVVSSALLGVGLAMDAFSISLANGLREPDMKPGRMCSIAGVYSFFQFIMPVIGWVCVHTVAEVFTSFQKLIPWIAFALLLWIGGKMLLEGIRGEESGGEGTVVPVLTKRMLIAQGVATSIDALSVGFAIAGYDAGMAILASVIIAAVTFVICMGGLAIGKKAGTKLAGKASILGGVILIAIGIRILVAR